MSNNNFTTKQAIVVERIGLADLSVDHNSRYCIVHPLHKGGVCIRSFRRDDLNKTLQVRNFITGKFDPNIRKSVLRPHSLDDKPAETKYRQGNGQTGAIHFREAPYTVGGTQKRSGWRLILSRGSSILLRPAISCATAAVVS